jgi:urocanate hydratase
MIDNSDVSHAMTVRLDTIFTELPPAPPFAPGVRRAPRRNLTLRDSEIELALKNALRYIPDQWHAQLATEFLDELLTRGRIYGYRFRPPGRLRGLPIDHYRGLHRGPGLPGDDRQQSRFRCGPVSLRARHLWETGQVCQNWMQYHLIKALPGNLTRTDPGNGLRSSRWDFFAHRRGAAGDDHQRPHGGEFDDQDNWNRAAALGAANYGQMTAGGWMYIGPQGIVHGTYSTILNAARTS